MLPVALKSLLVRDFVLQADIEKWTLCVHKGFQQTVALWHGSNLCRKCSCLQQLQ